MTISIPSLSDKSHASSRVVRWLAKPAPPRAEVSRLPQKRAMGSRGEHCMYECEAPPLTRSSLSVQSVEVQGLWGA